MNLLCLSTDLTSEQMAAWVQAIGSIIAIVAALGVAIWQARAQHKSGLALHAAEQRHARIELTKTIGELAKNGRIAVRHISDSLPSREAVERAASGEVFVDVDEIRRLDSALASVPLHELPSTLVSPLMILSATVRQFRTTVEMVLTYHRSWDGQQFERLFKTIKEMNESLGLTCGDIQKEVERAHGEK